MIEDKLEHDERIRLEALGKACDQKFGQRTQMILDQAAEFEDYIRNGVTNGS